MMTMKEIAEKSRQQQAAIQAAATAPTNADITPDPDTAPTLSELEQHFGARHWQKDDKKRTDFFKAYTSLCNKHQVPTREKEYIRRDVQGVEHLDQYPGTPEDLLKALTERIEAEYPLAMARNEKPSNQAQEGPVSQPPATPLPEPPSTAPVAPAASGENGKPERLPEAPFSANFFLANKRGVKVQFTIRAQTASEGAERVDQLIDALLDKRGYTIPEQRLQSQPASGGTSVPQSSESGTAPCALIKVGTSFNGGKPQLQFECDGFEQPLRYTRENLVQVLANVKQATGASFTAADMTVGRKFGGSWLVEWERKSGSDGKMHNNVVAVRAA